MKRRRKKGGWKNRNRTGNSPEYESYRHGQSAKGISTGQYVIRKAGNYIRIREGKPKMIKRKNMRIMSMTIDKSKRSSFHMITVQPNDIEARERSNDIEILKISNDNGNLMEEVKQMARKSPNKTVFISEHIGEANGESIYRNKKSIRLRKSGGKPYKERLKGGEAKGYRPSDFDRVQLAIGTEHELEHTNSREIAREIAMDHLIEDPDYYKKLEKAGL